MKGMKVKFRLHGDDPYSLEPSLDDAQLHCEITLPADVKEETLTPTFRESLVDKIIAGLPRRTLKEIAVEEFFSPAVIKTEKGDAFVWRANGENAWHSVFKPLSELAEHWIKPELGIPENWRYRKPLGGEGYWECVFMVSDTCKASEKVRELYKIMLEEWEL